jgi:ATP-binding cassette, subfamily C (CFTR/MRP), member 4
LNNFSKKLATQSSKRVQLVTEIIQKIKSVKTFCLEQPLAKRIKKIRNLEMKNIGRSFLYSSAVCFLNFLVKISIFACLASFSNAGNRYNSRNVYVVISYYNLIAHSVLKCWPRSVANSREVTFFLEKVQEFLQSRDNVFSKFHFVDKTSFHEDVNSTDKFSESVKLLEKRVVNTKLCGNSGISMQNVLLASRSEDTFELRCDFLELKEPKTYGIEDFTNFAKDFLFQIILGELEVDSGEIEIKGKISFASQSPCIIPGTLRENIVCGEAFDNERYKAIIDICKLRKDLEVMDAGNGCCIDESAKNLSFKAKLNLARCLYRKADIYVLDDPFGTFSFETTKCIFDNAIKKLLKV